MKSYLVTLQSGRMILIDNAFGPGIAKAAAYRKAQSLGMRPEVRSVSVVGRRYRRASPKAEHISRNRA